MSNLESLSREELLKIIDDQKSQLLARNEENSNLKLQLGEIYGRRDTEELQNDKSAVVSCFSDLVKQVGKIGEDMPQRIIFDYSRSKESIENDFSRIRNLFDYLSKDGDLSQSAKINMQELNAKIEELRKYFFVFFDILRDPPTRELFELSNNALLFEKINDAFTEFKQNVQTDELNSTLLSKLKEISKTAALKLDECKENLSSRIDLFRCSTIEKLESIDKSFELSHAKFQTHSTEVLELLESHLQTAVTKINSSTEQYDLFYRKVEDNIARELSSVKQNLEESKNITEKYRNFIKGGKNVVYGFLSVNIFLALAFGILGTMCFFKAQELKDVFNFIALSGDVQVYRNNDKNGVVFDFGENDVRNIGDKKILILGKSAKTD